MKNNKRSNEEERNDDDIQSKFGSLPLEEKVSNLFKMEVATITEAFNYVVKDPMNVLGKIGDAIREFGTRIESEFRRATSEERSARGDRSDPEASTGPGRRRSPSKPASPAA